MTDKKTTTPSSLRVTAKGKSTTAGKIGAAKSSSQANKIKSAAIKPAVKKPAASTTGKKPKAPAKKTVATASASKKATESKPAARRKTPVKAKPVVETRKLTPEERHRMVQTAAYFIAERNGFRGDSTEHWAAAELEIASRLEK